MFSGNTALGDGVDTLVFEMQVTPSLARSRLCCLPSGGPGWVVPGIARRTLARRDGPASGVAAREKSAERSSMACRRIQAVHCRAGAARARWPSSRALRAPPRTDRILRRATGARACGGPPRASFRRIGAQPAGLRRVSRASPRAASRPARDGTAKSNESARPIGPCTRANARSPRRRPARGEHEDVFVRRIAAQRAGAVEQDCAHLGGFVEALGAPANAELVSILQRAMRALCDRPVRCHDGLRRAPARRPRLLRSIEKAVAAHEQPNDSDLAHTAALELCDGLLQRCRVCRAKATATGNPGAAERRRLTWPRPTDAIRRAPSRARRSRRPWPRFERFRLHSRLLRRAAQPRSSVTCSWDAPGRPRIAQRVTMGHISNATWTVAPALKRDAMAKRSPVPPTDTPGS